MKKEITLQDWLGLASLDREWFRELFMIGRSGPTEIVNNVLVSDGVTEKDIKAFNIGAMIEYLGTDYELYHEDMCDHLLALVLIKKNGIKKETGAGNTSIGGNDAGVEGQPKPQGEDPRPSRVKKTKKTV